MACAFSVVTRVILNRRLVQYRNPELRLTHIHVQDECTRVSLSGAAAEALARIDEIHASMPFQNPSPLTEPFTNPSSVASEAESGAGANSTGALSVVSGALPFFYLCGCNRHWCAVISCVLLRRKHECSSTPQVAARHHVDITFHGRVHIMHMQGIR